MTPLRSKLSVRVAALDEDIRLGVRAARGFGYRGVQLDLESPGFDLTSLSASGLREMRHLVSREELSLESIRAAFPADAMMRAEGMDRVIWAADRAMQAAAGLSAGMLCLELGQLPAAGTPSAPRKPISPRDTGLIIIPESLATPADPEPDEPGDESAWTAADEVMREMGSLADRYRVVVAFSSELSTCASLHRLISRARCPWFGTDLDPVSVLRDRWDMEHVLDAIGGMLRHIRGRDALRGAGGRTQPAAIGRGSTNWQHLLQTLNTGAFGGWLTVDTMDLTDRPGEAHAAITMLTA